MKIAPPNGYVTTPSTTNDPSYEPLKVGSGTFSIKKGSSIKHVPDARSPRAYVKEPGGNVRAFRHNGEVQLSHSDRQAILNKHFSRG